MVFKDPQVISMYTKVENHGSRPAVLNWSDFCLPRGHLAMSGSIVDSHHSGGEGYWHLEGKG